jgi:anti-sigma factor RsiW
MRSAVREDLDCDELVELVTEYLEDALTPEERTRFEHHLVWCPWCVTYVRQIRAAMDLAGRLRGPAAPQPNEDLLRAFRAWKRGERGDLR